MMANAAAPQPKENMGAPTPRYDARLKVTGQARYPADTPVANPAYAVLVTSTIAKGTLTSLDLEDARAVPGYPRYLHRRGHVSTQDRGIRRSLLDIDPESWPGNPSRRPDYRDCRGRYV